jgi:hypothetical protein
MNKGESRRPGLAGGSPLGVAGILRADSMRPIKRMGVVAAALAWTVAAGCGGSDSRPEAEYDQLLGQVTSIDRASGEVAMSYRSDKHNKEMTIQGKLAPEAEILIDGATARLEDVRIGDWVKVRGRVEKRDGSRNWVALNVEIDRRGRVLTTLPAVSGPS